MCLVLAGAGVWCLKENKEQTQVWRLPHAAWEVTAISENTQIRRDFLSLVDIFKSKYSFKKVSVLVTCPQLLGADSVIWFVSRC